VKSRDDDFLFGLGPRFLQCQQCGRWKAVVQSNANDGECDCANPCFQRVPPPGWNPSDDVALETKSRVEHPSQTGWTLDGSKRTEFVLPYFKPTGRFLLLPFLPLRSVFAAHEEEWAVRYRRVRQRTDGRYHSECIYVSTRLLRVLVPGIITGRITLNGTAKVA
jgi:hypothetical protein